MATDLQTVIDAAVTELEKDGLTVLVDATQINGVDVPASGAYLMVSLVPGTPTNLMDGSLYEDVLLQVGAWSDASLTEAIANAEAARIRMANLDYQRSGGIQFLRDENFVGVATTYRLVAGFDTIT